MQYQRLKRKRMSVNLAEEKSKKKEEEKK